MNHYAAWILLAEPLFDLNMVGQVMERARQQGLNAHMEDYMFCEFDDMYLDAKKSVLTGAELMKVNTSVFVPRFVIDLDGELHDGFCHKEEWPTVLETILKNNSNKHVAMVLIIMKGGAHGPVTSKIIQAQALVG